MIEVSIVRNDTVRKDAKIRGKRVLKAFVNDLSNSKTQLRKRGSGSPHPAQNDSSLVSSSERKILVQRVKLLFFTIVLMIGTVMMYIFFSFYR